ncbi:23S rRNA (uracil(1939)-C(5))-methyltransferase [hydrothermal vent metagenome]|uniref:23S rRNA (Uracil(1939)-C(5))-methyltransferase n=1 Tax=hydrothermal vent metagenome TaxID=652676 RepID=A0A3B1CJA2_9ZZZZ
MNHPLIEVTIDRLAFGSAGVGRLDSGKVVFVKGGYPGDKALVRIDKEKKSHAEATLVKLVEPSENRREPVCAIASECGGCPWMGLNYKAQLEWKRTIAIDALSRIAKIKTDVKPTAPSPDEFGYRSRIRLKVAADGGQARIGYYRPASHNLVPVGRCPVATDQINITIAGLNIFFQEHTGIAGKIKEIEIESAGAFVRLVIHASAPLKEAEAEKILEASVSIKGLTVFYGKNQHEYGDTSLDAPSINGETLQTGAGAFCQVNAPMNLTLTQKVIALSGLGPDKMGLDLFCGIGNFTLPLARTGAGMTGIDSSERAIHLAQVNRTAWNVMNAHFTSADALTGAGKLRDSRLSFDTVILDPPRGGARDLIPVIADLAKQKIVYVSCDPPALARDAVLLAQSGFKISSVEPVDMFPQTSHLEMVCLFERD